MNDGVLGAVWCVVLILGFGAVAFLHRLGLPRTYARDLLHVGGGIWILGWPWWKATLVPLLITWIAFAITVAMPFAASRIKILRRVHDSIAGEGERWSGIVAYAASFAVLTTLALRFGYVRAAACAAAALCAGDGLGGFVGRKFGCHRFHVPWSKEKTWEGSLAVAIFTALGIALAQQVLSFPLHWGKVVGLGVAGAVAEALAPQTSDNVVVPAAVFAAGLLMP